LEVRRVRIRIRIRVRVRVRVRVKVRVRIRLDSTLWTGEKGIPYESAPPPPKKNDLTPTRILALTNLNPNRVCVGGGG
jgi:hypothetical protein